MKSPRTLAALLAPALLLVSCAEYVPAEQDLSLAYDADANTLTFTVLSRGLHGDVPTGPRTHDVALRAERTKAAVERLREVAGGEPYFVLLGLPYALHLDALDPMEDVEDDERRMGERWNDLRDGLRVTAAGLHLDEAGEVGLYQRLEVRDARGLVSWIDDYVSAAVLQDEPKATDTDAERASLAARRAYADTGGPWVLLDEAALEIRFPMAPETAAKMIRGITDLPYEMDDPGAPAWARDQGPAFGRALFAGLGSFALEDGIARFRYPFDDEGRISFPYRRLRATGPAAELRTALGTPLLETLAADEVRERLIER